ncbi:SDR family oxidoreductase [Desmospora profundinema]|uniref:NADP-dependent 3-hydroxy acid dehydrogenase YdfG n=1 Tax=Desmospora profundinema TaxID=1571184 RepID=A0ABU1IIE7_9BACL|nr:SDR family NAD(P)-dependent oxidoreductase [Desmospora profundinema]MDR6224543.1 NADP-dependent 3-hydroxy acid dehydrogenase YdfG [Desmospora profundinema]
MADKLTSKTAIVTGASKGLGHTLTQRLAQGGAWVIAAARSENRLKELAATHEKIIPLVTDLTHSNDVKRMVDTAVTETGRLDILINNAGLGHFGRVEELTEQQWDQMMDVNLKGAFLACKFAIPHLIKSKGHIVNISSVAGTVTFPGGGGYCASKFGLQALSDVLTQELKKDEVKVSTLCPGSIQTEFFPDPRDHALTPEQVAETVWMMVTADPGVIFNQVIMRPQVPPELQK